ncbi:MAG TPA: YerC/YecD family TrpR-related protein [Rhizomicrobium sp.]|jgi:TrpR-related protein YerC/YecD|nr:YerC/YecD family TrpR-related protein [Rhizomicrobium sp.]
MKSSVRGLAARNAGQSSGLDALCEAFFQLKTPEECRLFLLDLCTPAEISALAERWKIARLLNEGALSYREIHDRTGASLATITRVARFLRQEPHQGYRAVLDRITAGKRRARGTAKSL